ncbi:hypothetical protein N8904_00655 [Flavobacteriales bacterium]|nr:hypothetical protein [Flavobacteriales bacterium]
MKNIFFLFFLVHFSVYSQSSKKHSTFFEAGINNSFFESKSNFSDKLISGPNLGFSVTYGLNYKLTSKASFEFAPSISNKNLVIRLKEGDGFSLINFLNLRFSAEYKRRITQKYAIGIGADVDFLTTEDGGGGFTGLDITRKASSSPVFIPLVISLERNFTSKKNRKKAILFHVKKGFQIVDDYTAIVNNNLNEKITYNFKNSSISLTYRYYFGKTI